jgi:hypothetical protein
MLNFGVSHEDRLPAVLSSERGAISVIRTHKSRRIPEL